MVFFGVMAVLHLVASLEGSSGDMTLRTFLSVGVIWACLGFPLVMIGHAFGFKSRVIWVPCRVNAVPRPILLFPNPKSFRAISLVAGSLPFGCIFVEMSYIMKTVWQQNAFYYQFGFLLLIFVVLVITSAEVAILMTYSMLTKGNYKWWWLSIID